MKAHKHLSEAVGRYLANPGIQSVIFSQKSKKNKPRETVTARELRDKDRQKKVTDSEKGRTEDSGNVYYTQDNNCASETPRYEREPSYPPTIYHGRGIHAASPFDAEEKASSLFSENPREQLARQLTSASQRPKMTMSDKMAEAQRIRALRSDSQVFREARMDDGYKPRPPSLSSSIYARTTTDTAYGSYGNKYPHPTEYEELKV